MRSTRFRGALARLAAAVLMLGLSQQAFAQGATISGRVTGSDGRALVGAQVSIPVLNVGTTAGVNGQYQFTVPEGQAGRTVNLTARFIGYSPQTRQITLSSGPQTQNFELRADPFQLDQVVVTGTTDAIEQKKLTFSVAKVNEEQLKLVPATSPVAALAGKISGVRVAIGAGNPGAAPSIRLRGSTNLSVGNNQPLIIVDGIITRNTMADIDANDIESIEVLKGAAAASFYGSNAANGVVSIVTKRGRNQQDNSVTFGSRSEYGTSSVYNWVPLNQHHNYQLNPDGSIATNTAGTVRLIDPDNIADNPYPASGPDRWRNQLQTWLQDGNFYLQNFQLGVRRGAMNLNSSFTTDRNQGILPFTQGQRRENLRVNFDQGIGSKADFSASFTYGINRNDYNPTGTESWFALLQAPPDIDLRNPNPAVSDEEFFPLLPDLKAKNARGNPLYSLKNGDYNLRRERILGSFTGRYRPFSWLSMDASYGTDRANVRTREYQFRGYLNEGGNLSDGDLNYDTDNNVAENLAANVTARHMFFNSVASSTRLAYLVETLDNVGFEADAGKLNVTQVPDLAAGDPAQNTINSAINSQRTINYLVAQSFDIKDRYLIDALYRRDGSSLFGPNERWQDFYRVAGAWRVTEDFQIPGVQEFKLRVARGTAGLRPEFSDQYETYSLSGGQISKQQLGNKDLKPAIQTETEYGLNIQFANRFDLEIVNAQRNTEGAFLSVPLSLAQSGGFTTQVRNAADVEAKTWEVMLNTRVIDTDDFGYNFSITGDNTKQKITRMDAAPFRRNAGGQGQDVFYYKEGEKLGIIYGTKWVRNLSELADNPAGLNQADYTVNSDGYVVLKSRLGTATEAPIAYIGTDGSTQHVIGDVNPDFSFGFANNLRYKGFSVYALFDGVQGGDVYNFTKQWMYQDERHGSMDQSGRPQADRRPLAFYSAGLYNGLVANDHFVEDGSYVRLRELSVGYTFNTNTMRQIGLGRFARGLKVALIGRNVYTWTDYTGFDPEVTSGGDFNFRIDGFRYPNFRTITGQVEIQF
jgi:TonB-linked SusC/RagA family outer membrane protein